MIVKKYKLFCESLKNDMWEIIPRSVKELHGLFKANGKKLYVVGGAVRDYLNGDKPKDFDLATDALPDEVLEIVGDKFRTNLQGKLFGVVVVFTKEVPEGMEIATFRSDIYDGKLGKTRNPDVKFTTIDQDVLRRDLRINGLFYDLDKKEIIDLVGGIKDIKNKITRFVGNPDDRITEDPLRVLRVLRFSCRYNFTIDLDTKKSIIKNKNKLSIISQERIWDEVKKSFKQAKSFKDYLQFFNEFDMWKEVFPGSKINTDIVECDEFTSYIANLFKFENTQTLERKMVLNYKIEIEITSKVVFLIDLLKLSPENAFDLYKKKIRCHISNSQIIDWLDTCGIYDKMFIRFIDYVPSVSAEDLMKKGFSGKELGIEIKRIEIERFKENLK
jgi:tRNA nucleotidyltransferase/poly(A) polymerase